MDPVTLGSESVSNAPGIVTYSASLWWILASNNPPDGQNTRPGTLSRPAASAMQFPFDSVAGGLGSLPLNWHIHAHFHRCRPARPHMA